MDWRVRERTAAPLNLPADLASVTVPVTVDPAGIAVTPPTTTEFARVPVKLSPAALVLELSVVPKRTERGVPAGTTMGWGAGAGAAAGAACSRVRARSRSLGAEGALCASG